MKIAYFISQLLILAFVAATCKANGEPGADWTKEETEIIFQKLLKLVYEPKKVTNEYKNSETTGTYYLDEETK